MWKEIMKEKPGFLDVLQLLVFCILGLPESRQL